MYYRLIESDPKEAARHNKVQASIAAERAKKVLAKKKAKKA